MLSEDSQHCLDLSQAPAPHTCHVNQSDEMLETGGSFLLLFYMLDLV